MLVQGYAYSLSHENLYHSTITVVTKIHLEGLCIQVVAVIQRFQRRNPVSVHQSKGRATRSVPYLQCHHLLGTLGLLLCLLLCLLLYCYVSLKLCLNL